MDRRDYHPWGQDLDDLEFTRAVAMAAALAQANAIPKNDPRQGRFGFMRALEGLVAEADVNKLDDEKLDVDDLDDANKADTLDTDADDAGKNNVDALDADAQHLGKHEDDPDDFDPHGFVLSEDYTYDDDTNDDDDDGNGDSSWIWFAIREGLRIEPARLRALLADCTRGPRELATLWRERAPKRVSFVLVGSLTYAQAIAWIMALAALDDATTVHREAPVVEAAAVWGVPARVAVHGRGEVAARWRRVVAGLASDRSDIVIDVTDQRGERDIVLIAAPLRAGLAVVLAGGRGPRTQLVCVIGGSDVSPDDAGPMLDVLRNELRALGVVLTAVDIDDARPWLEMLLASARSWVDVLWTHARGTKRPWPYIAVDPAVHQAMWPWTLMHEAADRAAIRLEREGIDRMSARLAGKHSRRWLEGVIAVNRSDSEMGGPSDDGPHERLIGLQTALGGLGRPLRPRSWVEREPPEPRHARVAVSRADASGEGWRAVEGFVAGWLHRVEVWIAAGDRGTRIAAPFPEPDQPDPDGSVALTVVLCVIDPREAAPPQIAGIRLPARGTSERAVFSLRPRTSAFTVRVVVLHRQRVLQTMLLTQPAEAPLQWDLELKVHGSLGPALAEREPFDAAIIVNPSTALAVGPSSAGMALLPAGSETAIRGIQEILGSEDILGRVRRAADRVSSRALHRLALHGHTLWDAVVNRPGMVELLTHARRIQIVEAREGAYLPVELFYARSAPLRPRLCASAKKPLHARGCDDPACAAEPEQYVCPYAFWGLSRVLERMPHPGRPLAGGAELALTPDPQDGRDTLAPFERAVYAASAIVETAEQRRIEMALRGVVKGLRKARGWRGVADAVSRQQPSLLTLVTHTTDDGDDHADTLLQLELTNQRLAAANLTAKYIRVKDAARPLVLLVGCDTRSPLAGYSGFAGRFLRHGAAIVVCTITAISPADAADFLEQFAGALHDTAGREAIAFGELMLAVRQRLFAVRWPISLGVVSCGDALWYIDR